MGCRLVSGYRVSGWNLDLSGQMAQGFLLMLPVLCSEPGLSRLLNFDWWSSSRDGSNTISLNKYQ